MWNHAAYTRAAPELARSLAHVGRWLLPWISVLVLSATVAHATEQALWRAFDEAQRRGPIDVQPSPDSSYMRTGAACDADGRTAQYIGLGSFISMCHTSTEAPRPDAPYVSRNS
jgi:hypothetical protein